VLKLQRKCLENHELADFTVTGVAESIPDNSSIQFDMLLPYGNLWFFLYQTPDDWNGPACDTYVQLSENAQLADIEQAMHSIVKTHLLRPEISEESLHLRLQALTDLHHRMDLGKPPSRVILLKRCVIWKQNGKKLRPMGRFILRFWMRILILMFIFGHYCIIFGHLWKTAFLPNSHNILLYNCL